MTYPAATGRRPTITDVARAAGVSTAVVSYALNGRPGVSAATRERVMRIADELGWRPSAAARSMRAGARAAGLALVEGAGVHGAPALEVVGALQRALAAHQLAVELRVVDDEAAAAEAYAQWWAEKRCDVVVVPDVREDDPRLATVRRLGIPAALLATPGLEPDISAVEVDDGDAYGRVGRYLVGLGHARVAVVTGAGDRIRSGVIARGLEGALGQTDGAVVSVATDGSPEGAAAAARRLLTQPAPPSAIVFETDIMAIAALDVARRTGIAVPWDLSIVAGSDSTLCRLATPALTSLPSVAAMLGAALAQAVVAAQQRRVERVPLSVGSLAVRGSTGPRGSASRGVEGGVS